MLKQIKNLLVEEKGQGMTEYALVLGVVVAIVAVVSTTNLGQAISDKLSSIVTAINTK